MRGAGKVGQVAVQPGQEKIAEDSGGGSRASLPRRGTRAVWRLSANQNLQSFGGIFLLCA